MLNDERKLPDTLSGSTRAVHAGEAKVKPYGSLTTPIVQTSTYAFENTDAVIAHMERKKADLPLLRGEYGRYDNPTQAAVERKLAALDGAPCGAPNGADGALLFASGMNAATTVLLTLLSPGDHSGAPVGRRREQRTTRHPAKPIDEHSEGGRDE